MAETWWTPGENQGQIIEISYGWVDGKPYMHVLDRSDQSERWYTGEPDWDREGEYIDYDSEPYILGDWKECPKPLEVE